MHRWIRLSATILLLIGILLGAAPLAGSPARASSESRFGLDFVSPPGDVADSSRFGRATDLGVGWDRFPLYWSSLQPSRDAPIDFSDTDAIVDADLAHGLAIDAILVGAPSWAVTAEGVDLAAWSRFVSQTVAHYRGKITYWEMWNEPDLLDDQGRGKFWPWGVSAYYQLLKAGYQAAKAADPNAVVILGGLAFPYTNQDFFPRLLEEISKDPDAASNHGYFDILAFHSYDRVARAYELPLGYIGTPSFAGFRPLLRRAGLNPPIWINELGVPIWDYRTGQNAPGRATQGEQAAYVIESLADGLAAGVEKFFVFQLFDDGAGAVDPRTNAPAEFFGLITNDGAARPAYAAYRTAITLFSGAQAATHLIFQRGSSFANRKGIEVVTLYGTPRGTVTVAWNNDPGSPATLSIPAIAPSATVLDKLGNTVGQVTAAGGAFTISLPGATNNNNFDCYTPHGCDPNDYIIGGDPVILVENDPEVPPVVFDPLPFDSVAPFALSWHATRPLPAGATFDIQYRDLADGTWHDWLTGTTATTGLFGNGSLALQSGHIYEFRARARDAAGHLIDGQDYPARALAATVVIGGNVIRPPAKTDTKIEIVWPQGNRPVSQATRANITAAMFAHGTTTSVSPSFSGTLRLWRSLNNGVGEPVATGVKRLAQAGSFSYPVWDFNDVDVSAARDPKNKYYFWVTIDGQATNSNIWAHGADARTYFPQQDVPTAVLDALPTAVDAKIEIVWPHDNQPVTQATLANIGVAVFAHGTLQSVPTNANLIVRLYRAVNNGPLELVGSGDKVVQTRGGITFPTWQFNDVDVSPARDPRNRIYFWVQVAGIPTYSNVWTHGADARTYFPHQDVPTGVAP
ncbi:MAG: hypothetical protein IRY83_07800 [Chloroflexi bacterium]|nr:hypothetical protein [Chloroflexota bacterium]